MKLPLLSRAPVSVFFVKQEPRPFVDTTGVEAIQYPERDRSQRQSLSRSARYYAWNGSKDQLSRIYSIVEAALKRALEQEKERLAKETSYERDRFIRALVPEVTVRLRTSSRTSGDLDAVLATVDSRDIQGVLVKNASVRYSVDASFAGDDRYPYKGPGVAVTVSGADQNWVTGTYDALAREIKKDVPRWAALKKPNLVWPQVLVGLPISLAFWLAGFYVLLAAESWWFIALLLLGVGWPFAGAFAVSRVLGRGFLSFEVVDKGAKSQAERTGAKVLGATVAVGVVGSLLTVLAYFGVVPVP